MDPLVVDGGSQEKMFGVWRIAVNGESNSVKVGSEALMRADICCDKLYLGIQSSEMVGAPWAAVD